MAIRDRDRKILWSRAGDRCAICRTTLVREGETTGGVIVLELWDDLEPGERIRTTFQIDREVKALAAEGWLVFGARARGTVRGGQLHGDSNWETAYLRLVRADSPSIISLDPVGPTPHENSTEPPHHGGQRR